MVDLRADAELPFSRELVFETYRDKLPDLVPFIPNIRAIEVKSRRDEGDVVHLVNVWHGGGDIPVAARAFLSEAMLSWTDVAAWHADRLEVDWQTQTHAFTEAVKCGGTNHFIALGPSRMRFEVRGRLDIDGSKIPVPRFLAGKASAAIEEFLVKKITPNLIAVSEGVRRYLESRPAAP